MKINFLILLFLSSILFSCSFNKLYLQPTKVPNGFKKLVVSNKTENDSTVIHFIGDNYQPVFLKNGKDTIEFDYTIESVVFQNTSGDLLNGWLMKPKNENPKITLLHFHGNAGFLMSQYRSMTPLLQYGFQIFLFDYSGFGFSQGKATRNNVLIDGNSALTYVKNREDIKNTKLVIYGHSLGGHLAAVVASQRENEIDALVVEGAFSSHKDIAADVASIFGRVFVSEKYSAVKHLRFYKKPILVIHSIEDKIIPFEMGEKLYKIANEPKEFYEIEKCHICGPTYYAESIALKIKNMLKEEK